MSYVDEDPPKHYSVGELTNRTGHLSIYEIKGQKKYKYSITLNMDEIRALVIHRERYFSSFVTNSKKEYLAALEIQKRARQYIEANKAKSEDNSVGL